MNRLDDDDLHRYVDGRLGAERARALEAAMATDEALRQTVQAWSAQRIELAALERSVLDEPIPAAILVALRDDPPASAGEPAPLRRPPSSRPGVRTWLAAASIAVVSCAIGFVGGRWGGPAGDRGGATMAAAAAPRFVAEGRVAHVVFAPEVRHPVEVDGSDRAHLVGWLSKRLGTNVVAPSLSEHGFELVGGRLLPGDRGASAQFMYQDASGARVTLYLSRRPAEAGGTSAFRFEQSDGLQSFYWIDRDVGYVLSGDLPRARLSELATAVYRGIGG